MLPSFKKSETNLSKPASSPSASNGSPSIGAAHGGGRNAPSVIGPDLTINGDLISTGELQIEGEVQGDIRGTYVTIGEKARITGTILAEEIIIRGHVAGSVRGMRVTLQSMSRVEGDIFHKALVIEHGAFFEGKSQRADDPLAGPPKPDVVGGDPWGQV